MSVNLSRTETNVRSRTESPPADLQCAVSGLLWERDHMTSFQTGVSAPVEKAEGKEIEGEHYAFGGTQAERKWNGSLGGGGGGQRWSGRGGGDFSIAEEDGAGAGKVR